MHFLGALGLVKVLIRVKIIFQRSEIHFIFFQFFKYINAYTWLLKIVNASCGILSISVSHKILGAPELLVN